MNTLLQSVKHSEIQIFLIIWNDNYLVTFLILLQWNIYFLCVSGAQKQS